MLSYVWPDQIHRIRQLRAALTLATEVPATVEQAEAIAWTTERWNPEPGTATVVFHSIVMQYLSDERRAAFKRLIRTRGPEAATAEAPLAWLRFEPVGEEAAVRLTIWPGGTDHTVAWSGFHGQNVRWLGTGA